MDRVAVFVDYQNVYMGARAAFGGSLERASFGQIDPARLGELLIARRQWPSELAEVRLYRGLPEPGRDQKSYTAARRQIAGWNAQSRVTAVARPLRYPRDWPKEPAREKGIDVQLAVDLVSGAINFDFDAAIVFSADTDLIPAVDAVFEIGRHVEVAAWRPTASAGHRIDTASRRLWCHWLSESDFNAVADFRDYTVPSS